MLEAMGYAPLRLRAAGEPAPGAGAVPAAVPPGGQHPLLAAVRTAAGTALQGADERGFADWASRVELPDPSVLAADPRAKRALWHRMRRLRRPSRG